MVILMLGSQPINASEFKDGADLEQGLSLCRVALDGCMTEEQRAEALSKSQSDLLKYDKDQIERLESEQNSIFRSPFLWVSVGIITGIIVRGSK